MIFSPRRLVALLVVVAALLCPRSASAYSVLAHEAMVDALWEKEIAPLLRERFPALTEAAILEARAHAYGGSVIQDLGYYPFGNKLFSNLVHYVRSGDFVASLLREAKDANELAFAIGALAHYASDNTGHPMGTNKVVPLVYPKLRAEFGDEVVYAHAPSRHVMVEFSFDVLQVGSGAYNADAYKNFIGFAVPVPHLERAFIATYGLELDDVFLDVDLAIGSYRRAVSTTIPEMTRLAWEDKQEEIRQRIPNVEQSAFVFTLTRPEYDKAYGTQYQKPSLISRILFWLLKILPKIGPLRPLAFTPLTAEAAKLYTASFAASIDRYRELLAAAARAQGAAANTDLDTGQPPAVVANPLVDETYVDLVDKLRSTKMPLPDALRADLTAYFAAPARAGLSGSERRRLQKARERWAAVRGQ